MIKTPRDEVLASMGTAASIMSGVKGPFDAYCYGFADGIRAALECLDLDPERFGPRTVKGEEDEVERKVRAGAASVMDAFDVAIEKAAIIEELNPRLAQEKIGFTESVQGARKKYIESTVRGC